MSETESAGSASGKGKGLSAEFRGVPLWGWIAIVLVVGGAAYYMQSRSKSKAAAAVAESAAAQSGALPGPGGVNGAGAGQGGYQTVGNMPQTTTAESVRILTNTQWAQAAIKFLIQKGYPAVDSEAAVQNYVNGERRTAAQDKLIEAALAGIGPKPEISGGAAPKMHALHTAKGGNLLGQIVGGIGTFLGLDDPDNIFAPFVNPFLNNVIDYGPIGGVFQSITDLVGGSVSVSGNAANVNIPGVGDVGIGGSISSNGGQISGSIPGVGQIGVGIGGIGSASYQQSYTVKNGDSLTSISLAVYGNSGGAQKIYSANIGKIPNPNKLTPGTVLQIPSANSNA